MGTAITVGSRENSREIVQDCVASGAKERGNMKHTRQQMTMMTVMHRL